MGGGSCCYDHSWWAVPEADSRASVPIPQRDGQTLNACRGHSQSEGRDGAVKGRGRARNERRRTQGGTESAVMDRGLMAGLPRDHTQLREKTRAQRESQRIRMRILVLSSLGFITATSTSTGDSECESETAPRTVR